MYLRNRLNFIVVGLLFSTGTFAAEIPDYYSEPGLNPHRSYLNQQFSEHIDPFTGKLQLHYVDLFLPGNGGMDIKVQRSYTSLDEELPQSSSTNTVGMGWTVQFGGMSKSMSSAGCTNNLNSSNDNPVLTLPDGSQEVFYAPSQSVGVFGSSRPDFISKNRWIADCQSTSSGLVWTVKSPDGLVFELSKNINSTSHYLSYVRSITDANGNQISFSYYGDSDPLSSYNNKPFVRTITGSQGRTVTLNYYDSTTAPYNQMRLRSVSTNGQTVTYSYQQVGNTNHFRLTSVDLPGIGTGSWGYSYYVNDSNIFEDTLGRYSVRRVDHPYGGITTYNYERKYFRQNDFQLTGVVDRKVTSGRDVVSGVWNFNYEAGFENSLPENRDKTTVETPDGYIVYQHYGIDSITYTGDVWRRGLQRGRRPGRSRYRV